MIIKTNNDSEKLILATGAVLELALAIWGTNKEIMDNWSIGSLPLWGEAFRKTAHGYLKSYSKILTLEEHLLSGGFGSWILENDLLCKPCYLDVGSCGEVGSQDYLKSKFGLNKKNIVKIIEESMQ